MYASLLDQWKSSQFVWFTIFVSSHNVGRSHRMKFPHPQYITFFGFSAIVGVMGKVQVFIPFNFVLENRFILGEFYDTLHLLGEGVEMKLSSKQLHCYVFIVNAKTALETLLDVPLTYKFCNKYTS